MANQPTFRADPNAVPQINGWPGIINSVQKGYQLAQLPRQMKMDDMLKVAQLQKMQAEAAGQENINQYYGQEAEGRIANSQADTSYKNKQTSRYDDVINSGLLRDKNLNANTAAQTSLYNTQNSAAQDDLKYQRNLYAAIQAAQNGQLQPNSGYGQPAPQVQPGGGYGSPAPTSTYQPGNGGAPMAAPQVGGYQGANALVAGPAPQAVQGGQPMQAPQATADAETASNEKVLRPGNPSQAYLDNFASNPLYAGRLEKMGIPGIKTDVQVNPKTGQLMTVTTYPSGKIVSTNADMPAVRAANTTEPGEQAAYTAVQKEYGDSQAMGAQLKQLAATINQPGFDQVVGPVNKWLPQFGLSNEDVSKVYGDFEAASRSLQAKMASSLSTRGATNMGLRLAAQTKPNAGDTAPVIRGKMEALNTGNRWTMDYAEAVQRNMLNGMNSLDARKSADAAVPFDKYMGEMKNYLDEGDAGGKIYNYNAKSPEDKRIDITYKADKFGNELPYVQAIDSKGNHILIPAAQYVKQGGLK